jgi:hypothetical protein
MAVPSGFCPGTLVPRGLHVADDAMLPAFGPGEGHRPSTGQRAGAGRPSIGAAAGDPVVGAVTPRGRQPARPHAATPTRAALPRSPAIFYRTQPARRRDAKRAARSPSAAAAFVCETPFETSDFRKRNRRWERNRRRVDCGMHATAYACIPAGGGWSGGGQPPLSFSRLGRVKAPRKKIVCPTQTPAPGLPPHPSAATRRNPAPDCPVARVRAAGRPQHSRTVLARATSPSLLV